LETRSKGRIGAMTISRAMFEQAGARPEDADGIVQYAKALAGARVGVLIQEASPGEIRASLRSDGTVDANEVAARVGGRGHRNAGGRPGVATDTQDHTGATLGVVSAIPSEREVREGVARLEARTLQRPPRYSAVKVGGERLYKAARRGETLEAEERPIRIYGLTA